jgi:hydrocephalus-inducing protein
MDYEWALERFESSRTDYAKTRPCPFAINPQSGFIEAGQATMFRAMFSPMEVDDFASSFVCRIAFLQYEPPRIAMSGFSRRPLCHFNIIMSDYLTRRHPNYTDPLPDDVKVIELFAKNVKKGIVKKIEMINPTASPYEVRWSVIKDDANGSITCDLSPSLVSGGKNHYFTFTYVPASMKVVECLFTFEIPGHGIKVFFLFVGRINR